MGRKKKKIRLKEPVRIREKKIGSCGLGQGEEVTHDTYQVDG